MAILVYLRDLDNVQAVDSLSEFINNFNYIGKGYNVHFFF